MVQYPRRYHGSSRSKYDLVASFQYTFASLGCHRSRAAVSKDYPIHYLLYMRQNGRTGPVVLSTVRRSTKRRNAGAGPDAKCGLAHCQNWREMTPSGDVAQHRVGCIRWGGGETAV